MDKSLTLSSELNSSSNASYATPPEKLMDRMFLNQICAFRDLIFKRPCHPHVDLCRKWLKVFNNSTQKEKMARNCLCWLMQIQMERNGELGEPFTIVQNCNRDLVDLLDELDQEQMESVKNLSGYDVMQTNRTIPDSLLDDFGDNETSLVYVSQRKSKPSQHPRSGGDFIAHAKDPLELELQGNETARENMRLRRELESMRLQLTERQIENTKLKQIANRNETTSTTYCELFNNLQVTLVECIQQTLFELKGTSTVQRQQILFRMFEKLFQNFKTDDAFVADLHKCDDEFESWLNKVFELEFDKRKTLIAKHIARKVRKSRKKLTKRFDDRLRINKWAQGVREKFVMLQCFSILRQIVMASKKLDHTNVLEVLKELEEKYKSVLDKEFQ